jgi:hypothetical protein
MSTPTPEQLASGLLARLRPLFPAIAAATKAEADTRAWVAAWALVIRAEGLHPGELARGLENISKAPNDRPLTPSVFLSLCRPEGQGWEAYAPLPRALPEPQDLRAARRERGREALAALTAALRGRPPGNVPSLEEAKELLSKIDPTRRKIFL